MSDEDKPESLVRRLNPILHDPVYVFVSVPSGTPFPEQLRPLLTFVESEGTTLIVEQLAARAAGIEGIFPCRQITLTVHSDLGAVGLMAAVTARLARDGIAVNPVSGFYHDHLFVPEERADDAFAALLSLMDG